MPGQVERVRELTRMLQDEVIKILGLPPRPWSRMLVGAWTWPPVSRFARLAAEFDRRVGESGLREGCRWMLPHFARDLYVRGEQNIPTEGPLLVASNHPGTFDGLAIAANIPRKDLKVVATSVPFTQGLQATAQHLIYTSLNPHERMTVVRSAIRHLRQGGALLIFPSGGVDPDPDVLPGASEALEGWSPSLEILLRSAPRTQVLLTIVSGVLSPGFLRNPLARIRRSVRERQKVAESLQIIQQMLLPRSLGLSARLSFGRLMTAGELGSENDPQGSMRALVTSAQRLLADHLSAPDFLRKQLRAT